MEDGYIPSTKRGGGFLLSGRTSRSSWSLDDPSFCRNLQQGSAVKNSRRVRRHIGGEGCDKVLHKDCYIWCCLQESPSPLAQPIYVSQCGQPSQQGCGKM